MIQSIIKIITLYFGITYYAHHLQVKCDVITLFFIPVLKSLVESGHVYCVIYRKSIYYAHVYTCSFTNVIVY